MRLIPQLWKAVDEIPGVATDTLEWKERLGDEWPGAQFLLKATGKQATAVACPSPGGDGCPRRVVKLRNGGLRGVCSSASGQCEPIGLTQDDVAIMALDQKRLAGDLASALQLAPATVRPLSQRVIHLGDYTIAAGVSSPVLLALPGPHDPLAEDELREAGVDLPGVILMPQPGSLPSALRARLINNGNLLIDLAATTSISADRRLAFVQAPAVLLSPIRDALQRRLNDASSVRRITLPPGTRWGQLTLTLTSAETLVCSTPGWSGQVDPGELGMKSKKNGRPTVAWAVLVAIARLNGVLPSGDAKMKNTVEKQKQTLAANLRRAFGIDEDPLPWDHRQRAYKALFVIRDDRPLAERDPGRHTRR